MFKCQIGTEKVKIKIDLNRASSCHTHTFQTIFGVSSKGISVHFVISSEIIRSDRIEEGRGTEKERGR